MAFLLSIVFSVNEMVAYLYGSTGSGQQKSESPSDKLVVTDSLSEGIKAPLNPPKPDKSRKRVHSEVSTDTKSGEAQVSLPETANPPKDQSERKPKMRKTAKENAEHDEEMTHQAGAFASSIFFFVFVFFPFFYLFPLHHYLDGCAHYTWTYRFGWAKTVVTVNITVTGGTLTIRLFNCMLTT